MLPQREQMFPKDRFYDMLGRGIKPGDVVTWSSGSLTPNCGVVETIESGVVSGRCVNSPCPRFSLPSGKVVVTSDVIADAPITHGAAVYHKPSRRIGMVVFASPKLRRVTVILPDGSKATWQLRDVSARLAALKAPKPVVTGLQPKPAPVPRTVMPAPQAQPVQLALF